LVVVALTLAPLVVAEAAPPKPGSPAFKDPRSAEMFDGATTALAQLQQRGPLHARYPIDCRAVWTDVAGSSLMREKDPAAVKLVGELSQFCVHDLALKLADKRLEVIEITEKALEKPVAKFSRDGWDRLCGLPIDTLALAGKRYPKEADQFKRLAKPITQRCGKRPAA
jgi:hypothetical protein